MKNHAYLVFVDEIKNHNKFYEIFENDDGSIDVRYGRVGNDGVKKHYACYEQDFNSLMRSKINKGYEDYTALHEIVDTSAAEEYTDYKPVEDKRVDEMIAFLYNSSREFFNKYYTVQSTDVNEKMVREAENDLAQLSQYAESNMSVYQFNEKLKDLFGDIPRKMTKVADYMAKTSDDFAKIIEREREMLDNVKGQVIAIQPKPDREIKDSTYIEGFGLTVSRPTYKEEDEIISHLGVDYDHQNLEQRYVTCYKVKNEQTQAAFDKFVSEHRLEDKDIRHFYHGSKVENWLSIAKQGLLLNPDARVTGKMFGQGLYFAGENELRKSLNYMDVKNAVWNNGTRDSGYVALYSVALGKCYKPHNSLSSSFNYRNLRNGCLSVYADKHLTGLRNDEYIVYRQEQCTIEYLIEMRAYANHMSFNIERNAVRDDISKGFSSLVKMRGGFRAELDISKVSSECAKELERHIDFFEYEHVYIDYNSKRDIISITACDYDGDLQEIHSDFTRNDLSFLMREMKKAFTDSEYNWEKLIDKGSKVRIGKCAAEALHLKANKEIEK